MVSRLLEVTRHLKETLARGVMNGLGCHRANARGDAAIFVNQPHAEDDERSPAHELYGVLLIRRSA
jgi:hypothetical protein